MISIIFEQGRWKNTGPEMELRREVCPNPDCLNSDHRLSYPHYMKIPHCPECKKDLPGAFLQLADFLNRRVLYHLEKR